jgi:ComF family protein
MIEKIKNFLLDILFPASCLSCGKYGSWICPECFSRIKILFDQVCPYCEKITTDSGQICPQCRKKFLNENRSADLDGLLVSARYHENNLARLVHFYKYNFLKDLSVPLSRLIMKVITKNNFPLPDAILPVPLYPRRLRWRGFNQSELLADYLGKNLAPGFSIPILSDLIIRKKYTAPQMKIKDYKKRRQNIAEAFAINRNCAEPDKIILNKKILLIDDICTTGSTILECAEVLKKAGAREVFGAVIARQEIK